MIVFSNPEGIWWQVEVLPCLESWDPGLAWVHDHPAVMAGMG